MTKLILEGIGCLILLIVFYRLLIFNLYKGLNKGLIQATIHYPDKSTYIYPRIFESMTEYEEWLDEYLEIPGINNIKIHYIDFDYIKQPEK